MKKLACMLLALALLCGAALADSSTATITYDRTTAAVGDTVTANYVITGADPDELWAWWRVALGDDDEYDPDYHTHYGNMRYLETDVQLSAQTGSTSAVPEARGYVQFVIEGVDLLSYTQGNGIVPVSGEAYPEPESSFTYNVEQATIGDTVTCQYEFSGGFTPYERIQGDWIAWQGSTGFTFEETPLSAASGSASFTIPADLPSDTTAVSFWIDIDDAKGYHFFVSGGEVPVSGAFTGEPANQPEPEPEHTSGGLRQDDDGLWRCYDESGELSHITGLVIFDNAAFVVADGVLQTNANGLVLVDGNWLYASQGQVQTQYTGLVLYDGAWFYVTEGGMDLNRNGLIDYDGSRFLVSEGRIRYDVNGLWQNAGVQGADGEWYYLASGQVQTQYTGLALYDGAWFYLVGGKLAAGYTGPVEYDGATFQVVNGQVVG